MPLPQTTLCVQKLDRLQPAKENLIFFLHNYREHWVLSHLREGVVYLYDSLQPKNIHADLSKADAGPLWEKKGESPSSPDSERQY